MERLGLNLYSWGVHVKILTLGCSSIFVGVEIWANPIFGGEGVETGTILLRLRKVRATLAYVKLRLHEQFFIRNRNVIFRNYCLAIARKFETRLHGAMSKFADR